MTETYKVLLADDERMIREGIASTVDWERLRLVFAGAAYDGRHAYEEIVRLRPDIVITDIKMPRMGGLELIKLTKEMLPDIQFIVLSGYGEFELATEAMRYGVKHYLLKPCNEEEIEQALQKAIHELNGERSKSLMLESAQRQLAEAMPTVHEQLLRDCLLSRGGVQREYERLGQALNLRTGHVRVVLFQPAGAFDISELYALKRIAEELQTTGSAMLGTIIGDQFALLVEDAGMDDAISISSQIQVAYEALYHQSLTLAVSDSGLLENAAALYQEVQEYSKRKFYLGVNHIITSEYVPEEPGSADASNLQHEPIVAAIQSGDTEGLQTELQVFFRKLHDRHEEINVAVSLCIELMMAIAKETKSDRVHEGKDSIARILNMSTLEDIHQYIAEQALTATRLNHELYMDKKNALVHRMKQLIQDHLGEEQLSLPWLASNFLYLNPEYIGKLFRKETGEKFTHYVARLRIERAKELIAAHPDYKMYEIAGMAGFGSDQQYFGNVFKKYAGCPPLEYKKNFYRSTSKPYDRD
ncbi:response regulator [Paenibacillus thalictri]|uniref:Response regulator n=1 Tax=Paenibacillus thalictri TaxID=2527873 RepID=A0A4Q9DY39_9BACL|nr:response regulator [Paenibacillus thalictri]TBL80748.1 response regulator [Paenibacillus thalictri]